MLKKTAAFIILISGAINAYADQGVLGSDMVLCSNADRTLQINGDYEIMLAKEYYTGASYSRIGVDIRQAELKIEELEHFTLTDKSVLKKVKVSFKNGAHFPQDILGVSDDKLSIESYVVCKKGYIRATRFSQFESFSSLEEDGAALWFTDSLTD
ncbi:hypothetical protein [Zooshikella harenae]|uniref:Uncharacterized protein n=1 Tax=Zooshikella harenae TaxID=2827238 RepID=A0ABS5Z9J6_9GAMM|nr:hypothetical protein [Zooshikella harenae]MBU2710721.1 hypothetical protein [Zooshikella harenae]